MLVTVAPSVNTSATDSGCSDTSAALTEEIGSSFFVVVDLNQFRSTEYVCKSPGNWIRVVLSSAGKPGTPVSVAPYLYLIN